MSAVYSIDADIFVPGRPSGGYSQGLRIKIGGMGKVEKPARESDFDHYPDKPGDFLNIVTKIDLNYHIKLFFGKTIDY